MHVKLRQPVAAAGVSALNRPHVKATRQSTLGSSIQSHPFAPSFRSYGLNGVQLASRKGFSMSCLSLMPCFQGTTFRVGRRRNTVTKTHRFEPCSGLQCTLIRRTHPGHCDLVEEWRAASKDGTSNFPWTEDDLLPIARLECGGGEPNAEHIAMARDRLTFLCESIGFSRSKAFDILLTRQKSNAWAWRDPPELLRRKMALWTSCSVPDGVDPLQIVRRHPRSALRAGKERSVQTAVENFEFLANEAGLRSFTAVMRTEHGLLGMQPGTLRARYSDLVAFLVSIGMSDAVARKKLASQPQLLGMSLENKLIPNYVMLRRIGISNTDIHNNIEVLCLALSGHNMRSKMVLLHGFGVPRSNWTAGLLKASAASRIAPRLFVLRHLGQDPRAMGPGALRLAVTTTDAQFERRVLLPAGHREGMYALLAANIEDVLPDMLEELGGAGALDEVLPAMPTPQEARAELEALRGEMVREGGQGAEAEGENEGEAEAEAEAEGSRAEDAGSCVG